MSEEQVHQLEFFKMRNYKSQIVCVLFIIVISVRKIYLPITLFLTKEK